MSVDTKVDPVQEQLKKADQLRLSGSYDQARAILLELIKSNPFFAPAKLGLGRVYFESGDLANAKSILEEFSEFVPDHPLANKILAKIYLYFSQNKKARDKINSVLAQNPEDSMARKMLQEIDEADSFQEHALDNEDTKKNTAPANTATIAEIYRSQGHLKEALEIYQDLLRQNASNPLYIQKIKDIQTELAPQAPEVSATAETAEIDPIIYSKQESSIPEFKRVEITSEKQVTPQPESLEFADVAVEETINPNRKTRQEKLERMLYLVQQHRKGRTHV